ncbi:helix-turn-helix domain-containing protein [Fictibacillus nanhaiensis]|uniref:ArsR/SmtB family transcription factor n=1 Tax=Fictibacillus nanhaiensis TaxID=742169 RepID=UPI001C984EBA|nr:helix-turn-helix domain-containing protein [Fictibacillus nanhaiensis]MBY6037897.1 helix-turn-helix domain-containing protein [Fictibacillus nanhaiensis]
MQEIYYIREIEQLKVISDPLRIKIMWELIDEAKTGKMLADILEVPAPKIHYHLKEMERVRLLTVERTEEKNGIIQKFYRPVAKSFSIEEILPDQRHAVKDELSDALKENILVSLDKTKSMIRKLDPEVLSHTDSPLKFGYSHLKLSPEQLKQLHEMSKEISELISEFKKNETEDGEMYHYLMLSFPLKETPYPEEGMD